MAPCLHLSIYLSINLYVIYIYSLLQGRDGTLPIYLSGGPGSAMAPCLHLFIFQSISIVGRGGRDGTLSIYLSGGPRWRPFYLSVRGAAMAPYLSVYLSGCRDGTLSIYLPGGNAFQCIHMLFWVHRLCRGLV